MRLSHNKVITSSISSLEPSGRPSLRTYRRSCSNTMSTTPMDYAKNYRWYCWQMWHDRNSLQLTCTSTVTHPQVLASRESHPGRIAMHSGFRAPDHLAMFAVLLNHAEYANTSCQNSCQRHRPLSQYRTLQLLTSAMQKQRIRLHRTQRFGLRAGQTS